MGSKFGEVSESVSECTVQAFECVSVCECACASAQHIQYFMVSLTGIDGPNRHQRTCGNKSKPVGQIAKRERNGVEARKKLAS